MTGERTVHGALQGPSRSELEAAHCWERVDRAGGEEVTAYRRRLRLRQARWREARNLPIGHQPIYGGPGARELGSRIDLCYARRPDLLPNLLTDGAKEAARRRVEGRQKFQSLRADRLWADLLSSMPLAFNVFGELWASVQGDDRRWAEEAVRSYWPAAPGRLSGVLFEWSPGRRDRAYLGNQSAFDVALILRQGDGTKGVIGIEMKYQEWARPERNPGQEALSRYIEIGEESGAVSREGAMEIVGSGLQQVWQDHLLAMSMLQHPSENWSWARFVLVYPSENISFDETATRYRDMLLDRSTFQAITLEELLGGALVPEDAALALATRYLGGGSRR